MESGEIAMPFWSKSLKPILAAGFVCLLMPAVQADEFKAKVVAVTDGDSLIVLHDNTKEKVILYGIDCPELKQEFGPQAKQFTDQCAYGKMVTINNHGHDRNQRTIGEVYLPDGTNLNQELVRQGLAWWSDKYAPDDKTLKQYHYAAKSAKLGLWASANPIAPWLFRNGEKSVRAEIKTDTK
jgi:endonuclease YncB( thermonuclease family)